LDDLEVDLKFTPKTIREENVDAVIIKGTFIQPFGSFEGIIKLKTTGEVFEIHNGYVVVEQHVALW